MSRNNGGRLWNLYLYGSDGSPNELIGINRDLRLIRDDLPEVADFVLFGQLGHQATHLAVVPSLANADGFQPVAFLELNEEMKIVPIASSVDRCFDLLARYLDLLVAQSGDVGEGEMDLLFPWDVADLIARDEELVKQVNQGSFDKYASPGFEIRGFLDRKTRRDIFE